MDAGSAEPYQPGPELDAALHELQQLAFAASPGPWKAYRSSEYPKDIRVCRVGAVTNGPRPWNGGYICRLTASHGPTSIEGKFPPRMQDAQAMVGARNALPRLVATIHELLRDRERLLGEVRELNARLAEVKIKLVE